MKINIICVGKLKESFFREGVEEYLKRLKRYADVSVTELSDEKTKENPSDAEREQILRKEGERIIAKLDSSWHIIALCIEGDAMSSEELAEHIECVRDSGKNIAFIIGGSLGLWDQVIKQSDIRLSFSKMTFPHQLMRVVLLEQIYRSFRIIHGEPYHK